VRHALLVLLLLAASCAKEIAETKQSNVPGEKLYMVRGTILGREVRDNTLKLDHEAIPGFMEAMVMDYSVRGTKVAGLPPDQNRVEAKLHVTDDGYWITDVRPIR